MQNISSYYSLSLYVQLLLTSAASVDAVAKLLAACGLNRLTCLRVTPKANQPVFDVERSLYVDNSTLEAAWPR